MIKNLEKLSKYHSPLNYAPVIGPFIYFYKARNDKKELSENRGYIWRLIQVQLLESLITLGSIYMLSKKNSEEKPINPVRENQRIVAQI